MFLRSNFSGLKIVTPLFPPKYKVPSELFMAAPSLYSLTWMLLKKFKLFTVSSLRSNLLIPLSVPKIK